MPVMCLCPLPAARLSVKKEGPNKGRYFYCCPKARDDPTRCRFWQWAEDGDSASAVPTTPPAGSAFCPVPKYTHSEKTPPRPARPAPPMNGKTSFRPAFVLDGNSQASDLPLAAVAATLRKMERTLTEQNKVLDRLQRELDTLTASKRLRYDSPPESPPVEVSPPLGKLPNFHTNS